MTYIAFKLDNETIRNNKVVKGVFLRGQRCDTYNWNYLGEFVGLDEAIEFVKGISKGCRVYGFDGYGIKV